MTILFTSGFTYANGTTLPSIDANWIAASFVSAGNPADLKVDSTGGRLYASSAANAVYSGSSQADMAATVNLVVVATGGVLRLLFREKGGASAELYRLSYSSGVIQWSKGVAGAYTALGSGHTVADSVNATYTIRGEVEGDQLRTYVNGTLVETVTDSSVTGAGRFGIYISSGLARADSVTFETLSATDTTAPTLTSPTASATGATTASGSVTTDEANGTLYYLASANATETDVTVKAGSSQAVTAAGEQPVTITGLTAATPYYPHYLHRDAAGNDSAVASGAQFTTAAENASPSFTGPSIDPISGTEGVALTPLDVSGRFYDAESGLTFSAVGSWPTGVTVSSAGVISGTPTTAGAYSGLQVRATDAGALTADSNTFNITVAAAALPSTITVTEPLKNNHGTPQASISGVRVAVLKAADLVSVYETSGLTTNASGILATISDAAIITGQQYHVAIKLADGGVGITGPITAS